MNPKDSTYIIPEQKQIHRITDRRKRWEGGYKSSMLVRKVILILPGCILISLLKDSTFQRSRETKSCLYIGVVLIRERGSP